MIESFFFFFFNNIINNVCMKKIVFFYKISTKIYLNTFLKYKVYYL